jgi:Fe2+ or Zn2+ uptake regulation protein
MLRELGANATAAQVAEITGTSTDTARENINLAVEAGWVRREKITGRYGTVHYTALIDAEGQPWVPTHDARPTTRHRVMKCLRCGEMFESEGPHNRRCGPCNNAIQSPDDMGWAPAAWAEMSW